MADKKNTFILRNGGCNMVHGSLDRDLKPRGWTGTGDFKFTLTVNMEDTTRNFWSTRVDMGIPVDGHPRLGTVDPWKVDYPWPRDWTKIINKPSYKKAHPTDWAYHVTQEGQSKMHLRWEWQVNMQIEVWGPDPRSEDKVSKVLLWKSVYTDPDAEYDLDWDGKIWPSKTAREWHNTIWNFSSFFPEGEDRLDKAYREEENNIYFSFEAKDTANESWEREWQKMNYWHTDHPRYDKNPVEVVTNENYAEEQPLMFPPTSSQSPYNFKKSWLDDLDTYDFRFVYDKTMDYFYNPDTEEWDRPRQLLPASQGSLKGKKSTYDDTDTDGNGVPDVFEP